MGCGGSKTTSTVDMRGSPPQAAQQQQRVKTPSISSSSGVSSYRHSQSLRNTVTPDTRDFNQNNEEQEEAQLLKRREEEQRQRQEEEDRRRAEEERRRQEEEQRQRQEEERQRQEAEEKRRQLEAQMQQQQQDGMTDLETTAAAAGSSTIPDTNTQRQEGSGGRTFTPQEIAQHNSEVGWIEWVPEHGKVYDGRGIRDYFPGYIQQRPAMMQARAAQRVAEGGEEEEKEFVTFRHVAFPTPEITDPYVWEQNGVKALRCNGLSEEELAKELPPFLLGTIVDTAGPPYWNSFRRDVTMLADELRTMEEDSKTPGEKEYLSQLTRWQERYGAADPPETAPAPDGTDPNEKNFPLVAVDPDSFRLYLQDGEPLDTDVPPEGAWTSLELVGTDLGDPHELFAAYIRDDFDTEDFLFLAEGEMGWDLLPEGVIKDEVLTDKQQEILAAREKRTNLNDPEWMKKRREALSEYFIQVRELPPGVVMPFLEWAGLLEANMAELQKLSEA